MSLQSKSNKYRGIFKCESSNKSSDIQNKIERLKLFFFYLHFEQKWVDNINFGEQNNKERNIYIYGGGKT